MHIGRSPHAKAGPLVLGARRVIVPVLCIAAALRPGWCVDVANPPHLRRGKHPHRRHHRHSHSLHANKLADSHSHVLNSSAVGAAARKPDEGGLAAADAAWKTYLGMEAEGPRKYEALYKVTSAISLEQDSLFAKLAGISQELDAAADRLRAVQKAQNRSIVAAQDLRDAVQHLNQTAAATEHITETLAKGKTRIDRAAADAALRIQALSGETSRVEKTLSFAKESSHLERLARDSMSTLDLLRPRLHRLKVRLDRVDDAVHGGDISRAIAEEVDTAVGDGLSSALRDYSSTLSQQLPQPDL